MSKNSCWNKLQAENKIGAKFGMLTITGVNRIDKHRKYMYTAVCECGVTGEYSITKMKNGHTSSCGCLRKKLLADRSTTHGLSRHPLFKIWIGIRSRCYNNIMDNFKYYGGRGIIMCDEWKNDFKSFYDWAISNGWEKGLQIDRFPNNSGNYEPNNCRVATRIVNMNNTRRTKWWDIAGEKLTAREISVKYQINLGQLNSRIREGWDIHRAVHTPFRNTSPSLP